MRQNKSIRSLLIADNLFKEHGVELILEALEKNTTLTKIYFDYNDCRTLTARMTEVLKKLREKNKTIFCISAFDLNIMNEAQMNFQIALHDITNRNFHIFYDTQGWTLQYHIYFTRERRFVIEQFFLTLNFDRDNLICKLPKEIWLKIFSYLTDQKILKYKILNA